MKRLSVLIILFVLLIPYFSYATEKEIWCCGGKGQISGLTKEGGEGCIGVKICRKYSTIRTNRALYCIDNHKESIEDVKRYAKKYGIKINLKEFGCPPANAIVKKDGKECAVATQKKFEEKQKSKDKQSATSTNDTSGFLFMVQNLATIILAKAERKASGPQKSKNPKSIFCKSDDPLHKKNDKPPQKPHPSGDSNDSNQNDVVVLPSSSSGGIPSEKKADNNKVNQPHQESFKPSDISRGEGIKKIPSTLSSTRKQDGLTGTGVNGANQHHQDSFQEQQASQSHIARAKSPSQERLAREYQSDAFWRKRQDSIDVDKTFDSNSEKNQNTQKYDKPTAGFGNSFANSMAQFAKSFFNPSFIPLENSATTTLYNRRAPILARYNKEKSNNYPENSFLGAIKTTDFGQIDSYDFTGDELERIAQKINSFSEKKIKEDLPTLVFDNDEFHIASSTTKQITPPDWINKFASTTGATTIHTNKSNSYVYLLDKTKSAVTVVSKKIGKILAIKKENGKTKFGIYDEDGNIIFIPEGGIFDEKAGWSEFTRAFVRMADRVPTQRIDKSKYDLADITPFEVALREFYGDDVFELGIPFDSDPRYTKTRFGTRIPAYVIEAALKRLKEQAGIIRLQKQILKETSGSVRITTSATEFVSNAGISPVEARIMPIDKQLLLLTHLRAQLIKRGIKNPDLIIKTAIFNRFDVITKKVSGLVAFTIRVDEDGNPLSEAKVSFTLPALLQEIKDILYTKSDSLSNNFITRFLGLFSSSSKNNQTQTDTRVYRVQAPGESKTSPIISALKNVVLAPIRIIKGLFGLLF